MGVSKGPAAARATPQFEGPRTLQPQELAAAYELSDLCFGHSTLIDLPPGPYRPTRTQTVEVMSLGGRPVCQMGLKYSRLSVCGNSVRLASVGGVGAHPDYRGLGLATELLAHCLQKIRERGNRLVLISGTRGLYRRAGCVPAGVFEHFVIRREQMWPVEPGVTIRAACAGDASTCASLHQMETVHFVRPLDVFRDTIALADTRRSGENWILEVDGRPVGYVFLRIPWSRTPQDQVREMVIQGEAAGSRAAFVDALPQLMARSGLAELWLACPWQDADLKHLLHGRGVHGEPATLAGHTMQVLDFPGLMADLRGYASARLTRAQRRGLRFGQDGDQCTISRGAECLTLDSQAATRLVLGTPDDTGWSGTVASEELRAILDSLFPLPSIGPGLNCR
jgi:GNAT superfamily N-acetyltransferase